MANKYKDLDGFYRTIRRLIKMWGNDRDFVFEDDRWKYRMHIKRWEKNNERLHD